MKLILNYNTDVGQFSYFNGIEMANKYHIINIYLHCERSRMYVGHYKIKDLSSITRKKLQDLLREAYNQDETEGIVISNIKDELYLKLDNKIRRLVDVIEKNTNLKIKAKRHYDKLDNLF